MANKCANVNKAGNPCGAYAIEMSTDGKCITHTDDPYYVEKREAGRAKGGAASKPREVIHMVDPSIHKLLVMADPDVKIRTVDELIDASEQLLNLLWKRAYDRDLTLNEIATARQLLDLHLKILQTQGMAVLAERLERLEIIANKE